MATSPLCVIGIHAWVKQKNGTYKCSRCGKSKK